jgi:hypothetical protein
MVYWTQQSWHKACLRLPRHQGTNNISSVRHDTDCVGLKCGECWLLAAHGLARFFPYASVTLQKDRPCTRQGSSATHRHDPIIPTDGTSKRDESTVRALVRMPVSRKSLAASYAISRPARPYNTIPHGQRAFLRRGWSLMARATRTLPKRDVRHPFPDTSCFYWSPKSTVSVFGHPKVPSRFGHPKVPSQFASLIQP